jgi:hypothetical protein
MPGIVNDNVQPSVLLDDLLYRGIRGLLRCDVEFDCAQVNLPRRRVFLGGLHLSGIAALSFTHAGIHRMSRISERPRGESAKTA